MHWLPLQQPVQVPGPQALLPWHWPDTHFWLDVQVRQGPPPVPQKLRSVPPMHWLATQHPVQVVLSHLSTHWPLAVSQCCVAEHLGQAEQLVPGAPQ